MKRSETDTRLIRDVIPAKSSAADMLVSAAGSSRQTGQAVPVVHYSDLELKPEHESRLQFYAELARPTSVIQRVRRSNGQTKQASNDPTMQNFLESAQRTPREAVKVTVQEDSDELYKMSMDDLTEGPAKHTASVSSWAILRRRSQELRANATSAYNRTAYQIQDVWTALPTNSLARVWHQGARYLQDGIRKYRLMASIVTVLVIAAAAFIFIYRPIMNHRHQAALQSAEWRKDQAQWQCTLHNYQNQLAGNNKEQSCVNN